MRGRSPLGRRGLRAAVEGDLYAEMARSVYGPSFDAADRQRCKTAFLAQLYGQGARGLAGRLVVTAEQAEEIVGRIHSAYPTLRRWIHDQTMAAEAGRRLRTAAGRALPRPTRGSYQAVNYLVQGTAADVFRACCARVARALGAESLWLPIHDELICQVPAQQADDAVGLLQSAMETELDGVRISGTAVRLGERYAHS